MRDDDDREGQRATRRPRAYAQHLGGPDGPDWERPRRYEAYPTIKAKVGLPAVPRIVGLFGAVVVLALALFFLPGILNLGGGTGSPGASAGSSLAPRASESFAPTEAPAATPIVYTIKKGDTLLKVAKAHGITIEELLAANPAIKNANKISEGQQITIPSPSDAPPDTISGSDAP
jgi:LysM domain